MKTIDLFNSCNEACLIILTGAIISASSLLNITMKTSNMNFIVIVITWINLLVLLTFVCCCLVCIEHTKRTNEKKSIEETKSLTNTCFNDLQRLNQRILN